MSKNVLLIIDPQVDFHGDTLTPETGRGSLAVGGADKDALVTANFIKKNLDKIDEIFVTLDSHHDEHIAHQAFWTKAADNTQTVHSIPIFSSLTHEIDCNDTLYLLDMDGKVLLNSGWQAKDESLRIWTVDYSKKLSQGVNQFKLCIWPNHCIIGSPGQKVEPNIQAAITEWSQHSKNVDKTITYVNKGMNDLTEMYSAIEAEVPITSDAGTEVNEDLLQQLGKADNLIVAGEALSHCVNYTVRDIVKYWYGIHVKAGEIVEGKTPRGAKLRMVPTVTKKENIFILKDCMSPVYGFAEASATFLSDMQSIGVTVCTTGEVKERTGLEV